MSHLALMTSVVVGMASFTTPTTLPPERPVTTRHAEALRHTGSVHHDVNTLPAQKAPGRVELQFDSHRIRIVLDDAEDVHYLDAEPGYHGEILGRLLDGLLRWGYEPMDEDEVLAETFEDGTVRLWLARYKWDEAA
jgi:hypothetical protein